MIKELDPRLRRLLASSQVRSTAAYSFFELAAFTAAAAAPAPMIQSQTRRVLVTLAPDTVPAEFESLSWSRVCPGIYTLSVSADRLKALAAVPQVKFIEESRPMNLTLDSSLSETKANVLHAGLGNRPPLNGDGVLIGIIDFGLDFTLADFRDAQNGTRIEFLWDQSLLPAGNEHSPIGKYGVEYSKSDIDAALSTANPFTVVRHQPNPQSHGTHVAGIAAGNGNSSDTQFPAGKYIGVAPAAGIIFVQPDTRGTSFTDSTNVADAIGYILDRARELGRPCVVNLSLGQNSGSHDAESTVERAIDRLLEDPGRALVVAAGNEQVFRVHASGVLSTGQSRILEWIFGGDPLLGQKDQTPNELEIWYSSRDVFRVRVSDPTGYSTRWVEPNDEHLETTPQGDVISIDSERFTVFNGDASILITVGDENMTTLTSGLWRVELQAVQVRNGRYDAWIERDLRDPARGYADQSVFSPAHFDGVMTLATPSTSRRAIAVANYDHHKQCPSEDSSRGGTRDGRNKPEVSAPGTDITSCCARGGIRLSAGQPALPVRVTMSGTSMSAPHVAGIVALLFQKNPNLTAEQIRKILIASTNPPLGSSGFDAAWGYGKVDAVAALEMTPQE